MTGFLIDRSSTHRTKFRRSTGSLTRAASRRTASSTGGREVSFITPIPKPKKGKGAQQALIFDEAAQRVATEGQQYELAQTINSVRNAVDRWRALPDPAQWRVTPETARLIHHWRHHRFNDIRPFFCQVEAVETVIWLTEVAPNVGNTGRPFLEHLEQANEQANPDLSRLALKLATGGRQDHRHGHADRLADDQRRSPPE